MKISGHILEIAKENILKIFPEMENAYNSGNWSKISNEFMKLIPAPGRDMESLGAYFDRNTLEFIAGRELKEIRFEYSKTIKCKYAKYTGHPFTGCKTCGGTIIECNHEKQWPKKRNSKTCNSNCHFF